MPAQDKLWQSICSNCQKFFKGKVNWSFTCNSCNKHSKIIARARMEVYLSDDSGTLPATVFSPHFEKLTGMTGAQLHEADVKGQPLIKEVEEAIDGKKVFCFLKFFMTDKNYTVVQLYTEKDLLAAETTEMQTDDPESIMNVPQQIPKEQSQFFSPTTKAVLEEIAGSAELKGTTANHSPTSKRILIFGSLPANIRTDTSEKDAEPVVTTPKTHEAKSSIKKSKNKGEDKERPS